MGIRWGKPILRSTTRREGEGYLPFAYYLRNGGRVPDPLVGLDVVQVHTNGLNRDPSLATLDRNIILRGEPFE